ncbi:DUF2997 domain-containing protein [Siminovitchia acidinfaciens]|uniref:DUF2997 domain-containing protein n=1 Tax=Siminovitchia acidinfaciens TaxID=2321395 RepID=A0A429XUJ5_9BACI|nr:DUF2997 domain-containing protein [Siminovitchia acidinfaciens]RST71817.1 DUF2997 domain-containing protein [Siminovitchia acidinfaciens]
MSEKIQIRILKDGSIEAVTNGIKGKQCVDYISILENLLEAETVRSSYTSEYYETEQQIQLEQSVQQTNTLHQK